MTAEEKKTWWDGNSTRMWRLLMLAFISLLSFLGGHVFNKVDSFERMFAPKDEVKCLSDKVDSLRSEMYIGFNRMADKTDEIKKYLMESK